MAGSEQLCTEKLCQFLPICPMMSMHGALYEKAMKIWVGAIAKHFVACLPMIYAFTFIFCLCHKAPWPKSLIWTKLKSSMADASDMN